MALVAETAADARDVMVGDGKPPSDPTAGSGILQVHAKDFRPKYEPSKRRLTWPNGAIATLYNAVEPEQLRGPEHDAAWCDELCKWRYGQETWDQLQFGLRVGKDPRVCITTTPKPIALLRDLMSTKSTVVTRGKTYENRSNLAASFFSTLIRRYEGSRKGRQELEGELLEDVPGALWERKWIDAARHPVAKPLPRMRRIVVAIDPAASSEEDSDETGIMVCGLGVDDHGYVLDDLSGRYAPTEWARVAVKAYHDHQADRIIAEVNNGGEMVGNTVKMVDVNVAYKAVHASRGKVIRAEPVAALYEQGRVHHVGSLADLEDQLCTFASDYDRKKDGSPDRLDAMVWGFTELMVQDGDGQMWADHYARLASRLGVSPGAAKAPVVRTPIADPAAVAPPPGPLRMRAPRAHMCFAPRTGIRYDADVDGIIAAVDRLDEQTMRSHGCVDAPS
jgi:predicted phage terminase large subunit-like protein